MSSEENNLSKAEKRRYNALLRSGKEKRKAKDYEGALSDFEAAGRLLSSRNLDDTIDGLRSRIASFEAQPNGYVFDPRSKEYRLHSGFRIGADLYEKLFDYQQAGVKWLWEHVHLVEKGGGVFGDDMGLGKTVQTCSFLASLFRVEAVRFVLIVLETSLIEQWVAELQKWLQSADVPLYVYHKGSKARRREELENFLYMQSGVCITTYGMVTNDTEAFLQQPDFDDEDEKERSCDRPLWDYVILDEGHRIRNHKTKLAQCVREINSEHRLLLSGTPLTNNLIELWSIYDYVCQGQLFGSEDDFQRKFAARIEAGLKKDANEYECELGNKTAIRLRETIAPHLLRREKSKIFPTSSSSSSSTDQHDAENENANNSTPRPGACVPMLTVRKNDFIVWITPAPLQVSLYQSFLETKEVRLVLAQSKSPLAAITILKKIADHPRLLSREMKMLANVDLTHLDSSQTDFRSLSRDLTESSSSSSPLIEQQESAQTVAQLVSQSGKMLFLIRLLKRLQQEGHRTLIFSQSRKMLDIIQQVIDYHQIKFLRIDGTVLLGSERQRLIRKFDRDPSISCFLLTTRVGGVGLNLVSADRIIIFDPSWTTIDDQATDRVFRLGQTKNVVVYRLISCGTIEEKIYRKQVYKGSLMKSVMEEKKLCQFFTEDELANLFRLDNIQQSETMADLNSRYARHRQVDAELSSHMDFLASLGIVGLSDHNLLFTDSSAISPEEARVMQDCSSPTVHAEARTPRSRQKNAPPTRQQRRLLDSPAVLSLLSPAGERFVDLTLDEREDDARPSTLADQYAELYSFGEEEPHVVDSILNSVDFSRDGDEHHSSVAGRDEDCSSVVEADGDHSSVAEAEPSDGESLGSDDSDERSESSACQSQDSFVVADRSSLLDCSLDVSQSAIIPPTPHKQRRAILDDEDDDEEDNDEEDNDDEDESNDDEDNDEEDESNDDADNDDEDNDEEDEDNDVNQSLDQSAGFIAEAQANFSCSPLRLDGTHEDEVDKSSFVIEDGEQTGPVESSFVVSASQDADDSSPLGSFEYKEFFSNSFDDYVPNPDDVPDDVKNLIKLIDEGGNLSDEASLQII